MSELSEILKSEVKENEIRDYEEIKPQSEENPDESREYIDDLFSKEMLSTDIVKDKYPCQEIMDGKTYYYDDNGKIYRVDNELAPNTEYVINGYEYMTDDQGRIVFAKAQLDMKVREGRLPIKDSIESIGRGDQKEGDDRGHLIGDQFNGSNGLENMIPQNANINRNDFKNLALRGISLVIGFIILMVLSVYVWVYYLKAKNTKYFDEELSPVEVAYLSGNDNLEKLTEVAILSLLKKKCISIKEKTMKMIFISEKDELPEEEKIILEAIRNNYQKEDKFYEKSLEMKKMLEKKYRNLKKDSKKYYFPFFPSFYKFIENLFFITTHTQ